MTQPSALGGAYNRKDSWNVGRGEAEGPPPESKRAKIKGYLRAANELRQSYQQQYASGWNNRSTYLEEPEDGIPGAYPDAAVVQNGDEQMILFPSYARKHTKNKPRTEPGTIQETTGEGRDVRDTTGAGDAEFMRQQWDEYEDDNAVVDVDVRGWVFSPHKGQMTRKQRFFITLARQLAGLPAPTQSPPLSSPEGSRSASPHSTHRERVEARTQQRDEELVSKEAKTILQKGEAEAAAARRGEYSELPSEDPTTDNFEDGKRRPRLPDRSREGSSNSLRRLAASNATQSEDDPKITPVHKRASWNQPADMNSSEIFTANAHLMARLKPFISNPLANTPISAFFYNDTVSRQRTIYTNPYGHFALRAALDFVPTHVRILASEQLSATEEVIITSPKGVSIISDIDDTIKHSAISSGAREIFRNAFIRDLNDLTIDGVQEWYSRLAKLGVKFHYVSNSPWQLYPVITKFFSQAGLPPGSFHLKQYSGMLQGIFEPVAERKKSTLDRIARDFPERRFILVGDSGEADLEVYMDFVQENPGRVLGIFIRDVTTPVDKGFFDSSMGSLSGKSRGPTSQGNPDSMARAQTAVDKDDDPDLRAAIEASLRDLEAEENRRRPSLPRRKPTDPPAPQKHKVQAVADTLIDLSDDDSPSKSRPTPVFPRSMTDWDVPEHGKRSSDASTLSAKSMPPVPRKPVGLRGTTEMPKKKPPAPPPPRRTSNTVRKSPEKPEAPPLIPHHSKPSAPSKPSNSSIDPSYGSVARQKLASAYNHLPSAPWQSTQQSGNLGGPHESSNPSALASQSVAQPTERPAGNPNPPALPRRTISSYPAAAAQYATNRVGAAWQAYNNPNNSQQLASNQNSRFSTSSGAGASNGNGQPVNKRLDLWRQRWERAERYCRDKGVLLVSWRVGTDGLTESVKLVEKALKEERNDE